MGFCNMETDWPSGKDSIWRCHDRNAFRILALFLGKSIGHRWNPFKKGQRCGALILASRYKHEHPIEQTPELPVIWDVRALVWHHSNVTCAFDTVKCIILGGNLWSWIDIQTKLVPKCRHVSELVLAMNVWEAKTVYRKNNNSIVSRTLGIPANLQTCIDC